MSKFRDLFDRLRGRGEPKKPEIPSTGGHRGIATGKGTAPTKIPTNRATIPSSEVSDFVEGGQPLFVNSSNVAMAQFYPEENKMMIEYLSGGAYLYDNVTRGEAISFAQAQSKGIWVWDFLRVRGSKIAHKKPFSKIR